MLKSIIWLGKMKVKSRVEAEAVNLCSTNFSEAILQIYIKPECNCLIKSKYYIFFLQIRPPALENYIRGHHVSNLNVSSQGHQHPLKIILFKVFLCISVF